MPPRLARSPRPLRAALPVAACLALLWPAASRAAGALSTETRRVEGFTRIRLRAPVDARIESGGAFSVTVRLDASLQAHLITRVKGGTLVVETDAARFHPSHGARITIRLPRLRALEDDGSADVTVIGDLSALPVTLETDGSGDLDYRGAAGTLKVVSRGSGDIDLSGAADHLVVRLSGSGDLKANTLLANDADVRLDGSADATVRLDGGDARFQVNGSGDLVWSGDATVKASTVHGSGSITRKGSGR